MKRNDRYDRVLKYFLENKPIVGTELNFGSAFQLLVATVLSAQCTDKRVNMVTEELFKVYPTAKEMAAAEPEDVYEYIKSVSYPNSKATYLVKLSQKLLKDFGGEVPDKTTDLTSLPGVGRKTAHVVLAVWFGRPTMAVDTHVYRVSHRLGLVTPEATVPYLVERQLLRHIPPHLVGMAHHWLLLHGRYICLSRRPKCDVCPFSSFCPKCLENSKLK